MLLYYKLLENTATKNDKATMKVTLLKCSMQIISPNYLSRFGCKLFTLNNKELFSFSLDKYQLCSKFFRQHTTM